MKHLLRKLIKEAIKEISAEKPEKKNIYYVGVILDETSKEDLRKKLEELYKAKVFNESWLRSKKGLHDHEQLNHHMTIAANSAEKSGFGNLGQEVTLYVTGFGIDENLGVAAWRVDSPIQVESGVPHITALIKGGVKPFLAGKIKEWKDINPFTIEGTICEALDNGETNPPIL
jgi:hypothetical protein